MSYTKINNQSKHDKNEFLRFRSVLVNRKGTNVPISSRASRFLYGIAIKEFEENDFSKDSIEQTNTDEPLPEGYGELYNERKKIIFGNLIENDYMIGQFIVNTQLHMIAISKKKSSFFTETNLDIYNIMISLKETIANYALIIKLYLMRQNYNGALELFLLMIEKNKKYLDFIYRRIKEQLPKLSNANRIGKFYPSISKKYIEVLSCLIKLSDKFNKPKIHNMLIKYYIKTFYVLKQTILNKFKKITDDKSSDFDNKEISNYIYSIIFFYIAIFYFMKYHSFSITIQMLKHVIDLYKETDFNEISIIEKTLLLRTNYNLGLFLYIDGCSQEAIKYLLDSKNILSNIKLSILSYIKLSILSKQKKETKHGSVHKKKNYNKNTFLSRMSAKIKNVSNNNDHNSDEENKSKINLKLDIRDKFRLSRDFTLGQEVYNLETNNDNFGGKIFNEIELLLAEIEFSKNGHSETFNHIIKLLFNKNNNFRKRRLGYFGVNSGTNNDYQKEKDENNCNYKLLNEYDKRKIMFLLEKINDKYIHGNDSLSEITYKEEQNNNPIKYYNSKEMEKFFLFICSLSEYQLKILNQTQPKESELRNSLPIIFTNQFIGCLTHTQRMNLNTIESMRLSRYHILKNINKDIYPDNLDYLFMETNFKNFKTKKGSKSLVNKNEKIKMNKTAHQRNKNKLINVGSSQTQYSGKIFQEKDKVIFNKMLDDIIDERNEEFINMFRESIIDALMDLDNDEKNLFLNSKTLLKDLVKKMKKGMIIHKK